MHRPSPPYPHTHQALQLAMEVRHDYSNLIHSLTILVASCSFDRRQPPPSTNTHTYKMTIWVSECIIMGLETEQLCSRSIRDETLVLTVCAHTDTHFSKYTHACQPNFFYFVIIFLNTSVLIPMSDSPQTLLETEPKLLDRAK